MRGPALTHSGPDGFSPQGLTHHSLQLRFGTSTYLTNNYYCTDTWTKSRGPDTYNNADELTGTTMAHGSTTIASLGYTLDADGLTTNETESGLPGATSIPYTYNADSDLTNAGSLNYGYDEAKNLTELDSSGANSYGYNSDSELTNSPSGNYSYDSLGERTGITHASGSSSTYSYDQNQDLVRVATPSASAVNGYDGDGQLESTTTDGTTVNFAWDDSPSTPNLLEVGDESYIYGPNGAAIEQISGSGVVEYLHQDQIGSTRLITSNSGDVAGSFTYNPYGTLYGSTGTATSLLGYAGQYTDPTTGFQYDQARWYDPSTGQFMVVDPQSEATWQQYAYANDNPISEADPSGLAGAQSEAASTQLESGCVASSVAAPNSGTAPPVPRGEPSPGECRQIIDYLNGLLGSGHNPARREFWNIEYQRYKKALAVCRKKYGMVPKKPGKKQNYQPVPEPTPIPTVPIQGPSPSPQPVPTPGGVVIVD